MTNEVHTSLFHFLNSFSGMYEVFDTLLLVFVTGLGVVLILSTIAPVVIRERKNKRVFRVLVHIFTPVLVALIYAEILKTLYATPRPWEVLENVRLLFEYGGNDSFPSGHATTYGALATSVCFYSKRFGVVLGIVVLFLSISRVVVGIHWPIDIAAGLLIGLLVSYSYHFFVLKRKRF